MTSPLRPSGRRSVSKNIVGKNNKVTKNEGWKLQFTGNGSLVKNLFNAMTIIRNDEALSGKLCLDECSGLSMVMGELPWNNMFPRRWTNFDYIKLAEYVQGQSYDLSLDLITHAADGIIHENCIDLLCDHITSLPEWDGESRLKNWLITYGSADPTPYAEIVGRKWLISAIARAMKPGCQVDYILILQGPQRTGKTSAMRILGGDFYRSMTGKEVGSRDTKVEIRNAWICEFADLGRLPKSEIGVIKAFMSDNKDSYTEKYAKHETLAPRRCVFGVTDNPDGTGWLDDATGADRFWPVETNTWNLQKLAADRDQLLAEAYYAYRENEQWWIDRNDPVMPEIIQNQDRIVHFDEWQAEITNHLRMYVLQKCTVSEMLHVLGVPKENWDRSNQMRVAKILTKLGYKVKIMRNDEGKVQRVYLLQV